jgi:hypothetical protein
MLRCVALFRRATGVWTLLGPPGLLLDRRPDLAS